MVPRLNAFEWKSSEIFRGSPARQYRALFAPSRHRRHPHPAGARRGWDLFAREGYTATTVAAVAGAAGVSAQTVYNAFETKAALLKVAYDITLAGDDADVPLADRPDVQALYELTDPAQFLHGYAALGRGLLERVAPLTLQVHAGAAAGEADLVDLVETLNGERLIGTGFAARRVAELDALRPHLSVDDARDSIWTLNSFEIWHLLVDLRGQSPQRVPTVGRRPDVRRGASPGQQEEYKDQRGQTPVAGQPDCMSLLRRRIRIRDGLIIGRYDRARARNRLAAGSRLAGRPDMPAGCGGHGAVVSYTARRDSLRTTSDLTWCCRRSHCRLSVGRSCLLRSRRDRTSWFVLGHSRQAPESAAGCLGPRPGVKSVRGADDPV